MPEPAQRKVLDGLQKKYRRALVEQGSFVLSLADLPEGLFLRATLMNPMVVKGDLDAIPAAVRAVASAVT